MPADEAVDVLVVGAGPIGLEVAAAARGAGLSHLVLDAGQLGHTMSWWAPQTRWFSSNERISIAGIPLVTPDGSKATREQYLAYLRTVVLAHRLNVRTFEPVSDISGTGGAFEVTSHTRVGERVTRAGAVVLATGGTDFPRRLGVEGDDLPHVDGYLRDPHAYFGRRVLVVGGRNSAVEAALRCHHAGAQVSLCHRGAELPAKSIKYWILPELEGLLRAGRVQGYFSCQPSRVTPTHVTLRQTQSGETFDVEADDVLALIGYEQDKRLLRRVGVALTGPGLRPTYDEATMETNVPDVYVAGTAIGGTQSSSYSIFLENCHAHAGLIVRHLGGNGSSTPLLLADVYAGVAADQPES